MCKYTLVIEVEMKKLCVDALQKELKIRGLAVGGKKAELLAMLRQAILDNVFVLPTLTAEVASDTVFVAGTTWKALIPLDDIIDEPNAGTRFHAPMPNFPRTNVVTAEEMPKKRNFSKIFDRPPFVGTAEVDVFNKFKRKKSIPKQRNLTQRRS